MPWSVFLVDENLPLPAQALAKVMREALGGVILDHVGRIRIHHGWIARGLEEPEAGRLVDLLQAGGFPALKKSEDRLIPLDRKFGIKKALLEEDALRFQADLKGGMESAPWPSLTVVSAGTVKTVRREQVTEKREKLGLNMGLLIVTGIPLPKVKTETRTTTVQVEDEKVLIHLIFAGAGRVLEIRPTEFDYGYLGGRLAGTSRENLFLLLEDLRRLATEAHVTDLTKDFLATGKLEPEFKDDRDFLLFDRWIVEKTVP